jgi:hypothetical protein
MRDDFHDALLKIERLTEQLAPLKTRNAYLESELKREELYHTRTRKEVIELKQKSTRRR